MKKNFLLFILLVLIFLSSQSFIKTESGNSYHVLFGTWLSDFSKQQKVLLDEISENNFSSAGKEKLRKQIFIVRTKLKGLDFWLRYLDPIAYKKINGPLPVEYETEVFEKFEKPYRRTGAGLSLALQYLNEEQIEKDSVFNLIQHALQATQIYEVDSVVKALNHPDHFFYCNRLFLLNLCTIYTSGFECPEPQQIIPELRQMLNSVEKIYASFNQSFPKTPLDEKYIQRFNDCKQYVNEQPQDFEKFDHFSFIKDFVNPLFIGNQQLIEKYQVHSKSLNDYSLNDKATSIFSKSLYRAQNTKGIYSRIYDQKTLNEIKKLGELLFYDPLLSGNNLRSCASCHQPDMAFADTTFSSALQFNGEARLPRNTPSLLNVNYNHLLMADGLHNTLQQQAKAVITNSLEMNCDEKSLLKKVLSCATYKEGFKRLLPYTPTETEITCEHLYSALTVYYGDFSKYEAPFDHYMNKNREAPEDVKVGFNIFMGKAQCATCHFAPIFNGVKPPYVGSEFEVLGVPADSAYKNLSGDKGRQVVFEAPEMKNAFRTGTLRNAKLTKPYMHNGVFSSLEQTLDFYNNGGGIGNGLKLQNQTLSADSLHLDEKEKKQLLAFLESLTEEIPVIQKPGTLPISKNKSYNSRKLSGSY